MSAAIELTPDTLKKHPLPPIASGDKDERGSILIIAGSREVAGAALLFLPGPAAASGVLVLGLAVAPVFPLLTLTTKDRVGEHHADRVIGLQVAAGSAGAMAVPAVLGVLIDRYGAAILAPSLVALALVSASTYVLVTRRPRVPTSLP